MTIAVYLAVIATGMLAVQLSSWRTNVATRRVMLHTFKSYDADHAAIQLRLTTLEERYKALVPPQGGPRDRS